MPWRFRESSLQFGQAFPQFEEPSEAYADNPLAEKYPLIFLTSKTRFRNHSYMSNTPWFHQMYGEPLMLNPVAAKARGLEDGDTAHVFGIESFKPVAKPAVILSTAYICVAAALILIDLGGVRRAGVHLAVRKAARGRCGFQGRFARRCGAGGVTRKGVFPPLLGAGAMLFAPASCEWNRWNRYPVSFPSDPLLQWLLGKRRFDFP